jgi:integrase
MPQIIEDRLQVLGVNVSLYRQSAGGTVYGYFSVNRKAHRVNLGTKVLRDARAAARSAIQLVQGTTERRDVPKDAAPLVEQYLAARWPSKPKDNLTYIDHRNRLNAFVKRGFPANPARLSFEEAVQAVQSLYDKRDNGRTQRNDREVLRAYFVWLMRERFVAWPRNPVGNELLRLKPLEAPEPAPLTADQVQALIPHAKKSPIWPVFLLCAGAGLRPAEALRVGWSNLDLAAAVVRVVNRKGKSRRPREVPLNGWVIEELKALPRAGELLYPFTRRPAFMQMEAVADAAGVSASLQRLRQTACTIAIESGMSILDYSRIFGHDLSLAQRHYHRYQQPVRAAAMESLSYAKPLHKPQA